MSIRPFDSPIIYEAVRVADVIERGHVELNSGRHTMHKVHLERIINHPAALELVLNALQESAWLLEVEAIIPVPDGASEIVRNNPFKPELRTLYPDKLGKHQFELGREDRKLLHGMGRVAIFEDVVTTGGTPAAMADMLRALNPDLEIHLIDGWLRGKIEPQYGRRFASMTHIIARRLQDWAPEECPHHLLTS